MIFYWLFCILSLIIGISLKSFQKSCFDREFYPIFDNFKRVRSVPSSVRFLLLLK